MSFHLWTPHSTLHLKYLTQQQRTAEYFWLTLEQVYEHQVFDGPAGTLGDVFPLCKTPHHTGMSSPVLSLDHFMTVKFLHI